MERKSNVSKSHRNRWNLYVELSAIITLLFLITGFYSFPKLERKTDIIPIYSDDPIQIVDIIPTRQIKVNKMPEFIKSVKVINEYKPVIKIDAEIENPEKLIEEIVPVLPIPQLIPDTDEDIPIKFEDLSQIPQIKSVGYKLKYPSLARKAGIEGTVLVKTLIDKEGNVLETELFKSVGAGCDEEALEYVKLLKFKPGTQQDKPVKVWMVIPIKFILKSN